MKILKLMFAQLFKYNHKKIQFITAPYTAQFVAMWLGTFGCWFGEPVTFGLSYGSATLLNLSEPDEKRKWRAIGSLKKEKRPVEYFK